MMTNLDIKYDLLEDNKLSICSDYDIDCKDVENLLKCFIGGIQFIKNGDITLLNYIFMADGICPRMLKK